VAELEALKELEPPYEILELKPGETVSFTVLDWQLGKMTIHPRWPGAPSEKVVRAVRVFVPKEEKPLFPHYWDITAGTLVPQIYTLLREARVPPNRVKITITKVGAAPKARFSVSYTLA